MRVLYGRVRYGAMVVGTSVFVALDEDDGFSP